MKLLAVLAMAFVAVGCQQKGSGASGPGTGETQSTLTLKTQDDQEFLGGLLVAGSSAEKALEILSSRVLNYALAKGYRSVSEKSVDDVFAGYALVVHAQNNNIVMVEKIGGMHEKSNN